MRPVWLQGSRVTTAVPPLARSPAARSAWISACGPPARWCQPSPAVRPAESRTTQPTTGLGLVCPMPRAASSMARLIAAVSTGVWWPPGPPASQGTDSGAVGNDRSGNETMGTPQSEKRARPGKWTGRAVDGGVPMLARRALPPIRTFTVGAGISPAQPAAGCGRVADCYRRLGITPTPECAAAFISVRLQSATADRGPCERSLVGCLTAPGPACLSRPAGAPCHSGKDSSHFLHPRSDARWRRFW